MQQPPWDHEVIIQGRIVENSRAERQGMDKDGTIVVPSQPQNHLFTGF